MTRTTKWLSLTAAAALICSGVEPLLAATLAERLAPCLACHGEHGQSENVEVPSLGGQPAPYLLNQLYVFRERQRLAPIMNEMTKDFTDDDLRAFSAAIAKLPPPQPPQPPAEAPDAARMQRAQALIEQHRCNFCHDLNLAGRDSIPRLADQREDYLAKTLHDYKSKTRTGYDLAMLEVAAAVSDADILDLAYYIARLR